MSEKRPSPELRDWLKGHLAVYSHSIRDGHKLFTIHNLHDVAAQLKEAEYAIHRAMAALELVKKNWEGK
jgi:hypothetical protein